MNHDDRPDGVRLQKVLAQAGVASRRASEELIAAGRVSVDGKVVREMGRRVDPDTAVVHVDGNRVVLRDDLVNLVPMQRFKDTIDYHSTVRQAAQTAARAGVDTLVLTHQIPTPAPESAEEWAAIARREFGGRVVVGDDLIRVTTAAT